MYHALLGPEHAQIDHQRACHCQRTWLRTIRFLVMVFDYLMNQVSKETLPIQLTNQIIRKLNNKQGRWVWKAQDNSLSITIAGREQWDLYNWALVSISRAFRRRHWIGDKWKIRELRLWRTGLNQNQWEIFRSSRFCQFLSTFHPGFQ